jgi:hypothetical protein
MPDKFSWNTKPLIPEFDKNYDSHLKYQIKTDDLDTRHNIFCIVDYLLYIIQPNQKLTFNVIFTVENLPRIE